MLRYLDDQEFRSQYRVHLNSDLLQLLDWRIRPDQGWFTVASNFVVVSRPYRIVVVNDFLAESDVFYEIMLSELRLIEDDIQRVHPFNRWSVSSGDVRHIIETNFLLDRVREIFHTSVRRLMERIFNVSLEGRMHWQIEAYRPGEYRLCDGENYHNQRVGFILFLTKDWKMTDGGLYEVIGHDVEGKPTSVQWTYVPVFNSFLCFEMNGASYYQISEVIPHQDQSKVLTVVRGWFESSSLLNGENSIFPHGKLNDPRKWVKSIPIICKPGTTQYLLDNVRNHIPDTDRSIRDFRIRGFCCLNNFFKRDYYDRIRKYLASTKRRWQRVGPLNRRSMDVRRFKRRSYRSLNLFIKACATQQFLDYIKAICMGPNANFNPTTVEIEIARWGRDCYARPVHYRRTGTNNFDIHIFFNVNTVHSNIVENVGGAIILMKNEFTSFEQINPENNLFCLINCSQGQVPPFVTKLPPRYDPNYYYSIRLRFLSDGGE